MISKWGCVQFFFGSAFVKGRVYSSSNFERTAANPAKVRITFYTSHMITPSVLFDKFTARCYCCVECFTSFNLFEKVRERDVPGQGFTRKLNPNSWFDLSSFNGFRKRLIWFNFEIFSNSSHDKGKCTLLRFLHNTFEQYTRLHRHRITVNDETDMTTSEHEVHVLQCSRSISIMDCSIHR